MKSISVTEEELTQVLDEVKTAKRFINDVERTLEAMIRKFKTNEDFPIYIERVFTLEELVEFANDYCGAFTSRSRVYKDVQVRQIFTYLARQHGHVYEKIGKATKYNHPTCMHAVMKVEDYLYIKDISFLKLFKTIVNKFNEHLKNKGNECLDSIVEGNNSNTQPVISDLVPR
jgi:chromosomal replication initiation ATPase DnaA